MTPFLPDDYCLHCHEQYQNHAEGKCLFDATTFVFEPVRSAIVRNSINDLQANEDAEFFRLLEQISNQ
jgi:hypothetical protein